MTNCWQYADKVFPENFVDVLGFVVIDNRECYYMEVYYDGESWGTKFVKTSGFDFKVIAWMPLIDPPSPYCKISNSIKVDNHIISQRELCKKLAKVWVENEGDYDSFTWCWSLIRQCIKDEIENKKGVVRK